MRTFKYKALLLLGLLLILIVLSYNYQIVNSQTPSPTTPAISQPVYKVGDYFVYKFNVTGVRGEQSCSKEITARLEIAKIDLPYVEYKVIAKGLKVKEPCPSGPIENLLKQFSPEEGEFQQKNRIDVRPNVLKEFPPLFVDPDYTTTLETSTSTSALNFTTTVKVSVKYNKGILINLNFIWDFGQMGKATLNLNLIETSVAGLLQTPTTAPTPAFFDYLLWLIIGLIIAVIAGLTYFLIKKRKAA